MNQFENDNPFLEWNGPENGNPFKPWNNPMYSDDPCAPWNNPMSDKKDYDDYLREKGLDQ